MCDELWPLIFFSVCLSPLYKSFISACSQFPYEIIVHFQVGWSLQFWSILKNLKILLKLELKIPWNLYNFKVSIYFLVKNWLVLRKRLFPMKCLFLVIKLDLFLELKEPENSLAYTPNAIKLHLCTSKFDCKLFYWSSFHVFLCLKNFLLLDSAMNQLIHSLFLFFC